MKTKLLLLVVSFQLVIASCSKTDDVDANGIGATKTGNCWCTDYVAHELSLSHYGNATDWIDQTLSPAGNFYISNYPSVGNVVVFVANYNGTLLPAESNGL